MQAKVVDILGWNISVYHAHANITPPPGEDGVVRDGQYRARGSIYTTNPDVHGWMLACCRANRDSLSLPRMLRDRPATWVWAS